MLEIVLRTIVIKKRARIYTTIVQIIVKDDRGKAIAWRSVSCKVTCYHVSDKKTIRILSPHFVPSLQSTVCVLYLVCILYPVCSLQSAFELAGLVLLFLFDRASSPDQNIGAGCIWLYVEELPRKSKRQSNDYFITTDDERKFVAYHYDALPRDYGVCASP